MPGPEFECILVYMYQVLFSDADPMVPVTERAPPPPPMRRGAPPPPPPPPPPPFRSRGLPPFHWVIPRRVFLVSSWEEIPQTHEEGQTYLD